MNMYTTNSPIDKIAKREYDKKLGNYLKEKRVKSGCSQGDIAKVAGLKSYQFISNIERGLCAVPHPLLRIMINEYSINVRDFLSFLSSLNDDYYKTVFTGGRGKKGSKSRSN